MEKTLIYKVEDINQVPLFYRSYIEKALSTDILKMLEIGKDQMLNLLDELSEEEGNFKYAPDKWTLKELILHIIDSERVMAYRALRFSRNDQIVLPGFNQDIFVDAVRKSLQNRTIESLKREYLSVRNASITLFENFEENDLHKKGNANSFEITVGLLGYIITGHEQHHLQIFRERYLPEMKK